LNKTLLSHFFLLIANLIYAINYTFAKDVMPNYIKPSGFVLLRIIGALFLFGITYFLFVNEKIEKKDILKFAICGLFGVAINQMLFFEGLNLTTPINASIIMTTNPILVIILSFIIIKEKLTIRKGVGVLLGIIGATSLILTGGDISLKSDMQVGNLFVFINAISYGLYLVIVQSLMKKYKAITVMFFVFTFGLIYVFPIGFNNLLEVNWNSIPDHIFLEIGFVIVCTTFIAYLFNASALKNLNPSTVSIYIYLQPILATVFAIIRKSDHLDGKKILSCLIIFLGVYLVSVYPKKVIKNKLS